MSKVLLRERMRAQRASYPQERRLEDAQRVFECVRRLTVYRRARTVMAYAAARGELSVQAVMEDILATGRRLVLPRCEGPGVMTARRIRGANELCKGAYGLLEPMAACEVIAPQEIDLVLAPGIAFDRMGGRLGQGGGYYDRFLPQTKAYRLGICYDFALIEAVEGEAHDQKMDALATPSGLITVSHYAAYDEDGIHA